MSKEERAGERSGVGRWTGKWMERLTKGGEAKGDSRRDDELVVKRKPLGIVVPIA